MSVRGETAFLTHPPHPLELANTNCLHPRLTQKARFPFSCSNSVTREGVIESSQAGVKIPSRFPSLAKAKMKVPWYSIL
jgi:hypothetical protein